MAKSFSPSLEYLDLDQHSPNHRRRWRTRRHMKSNQEDVRSPLPEVWFPLNDARPPFERSAVPLEGLETPPLEEVQSPLKDARHSLDEVRSPLKDARSPLEEVQEPPGESAVPLEGCETPL